MIFDDTAARCDKVWAPVPLSYITAIVSLVLSLVTVPGNTLICIAIIRDPRNELRTSFNYFVLNLAASDLIVGLITEPTFIVYHIREALGYPQMESIWFTHFCYFVSSAASLLSLSALTLDRYLTVTALYARRMKPRRVLMLSVFLWILSISLSCIYFATGFLHFAFIFANTAVTATVISTIFSYIRIYQALRAQVSRWNSVSQNFAKIRAEKFENKVTRAFLLILMFFACCLVPSCTLNYTMNFCHTCSCDSIHWMKDFQCILILINCSSNQFLYAWRMPTFRKAFREIVKYRTTSNGPQIGGFHSSFCDVTLSNLGSENAACDRLSTDGDNRK